MKTTNAPGRRRQRPMEKSGSNAPCDFLFKSNTASCLLYAHNHRSDPISECRPTAHRESGASARPSRASVLRECFRTVSRRTQATRYGHVQRRHAVARTTQDFGPLPGSLSSRRDHTRPNEPDCAFQTFSEGRHDCLPPHI